MLMLKIYIGRLTPIRIYMDKVIEDLNTQKIFGPYLEYVNLPNQGIVKISD